MVNTMNKENMPQPYLANMTYDENCWLIIDCRSNDTPYVSFYNPNQDKDKEYENFQEFAQVYIENEFSRFENNVIEYKENSASATGSSAKEDEDFDEESNRVWKVYVPEAQVIEVMTGVKLENIPDKIKQLEKTLSNVETEEVQASQESAQERKDPYGYRGLSQRDFF